VADRYEPDVPSGGRARDSGGCYHLSFRSGSRAGGVSARAAHAYVTRDDEYSDEDRDPAIHIESGHMPSWAEDDAGTYWDAADLYERANGRLYVSADFALPRDLSVADQIALARDFAESITAAERLPYTLAIHAGHDADGHAHNPHAHLMFSERRNDGFERSREDWFRRANQNDPQRGGAPKSRTFHGREWVEQAREKWATLTNAMLEARGRAERVDHRSYTRQGIDREPGRHYGPAAPHVVGRGEPHERLDVAAAVSEREQTVRELDNEIGHLEALRASIVDDGLSADQDREARHSSGTSTPGRDDDVSWGR